MRCTNCHGISAPDKRYCGDCGAALTGSAGLSPNARPPAVTGERRPVTVVFGDLVGFTALSGRLDPEDLAERLAGFHQVCADAAAEYGGHIAQFLGDGVVVYFGYPRAQEQDAAQAVRWALAVQRDLAGHSFPDAVPLVARIGLHSGRVLMAAQMAGAHREVLALGDVPNIAARVTAAATPGAVIVTQDTWELLQGAFEGLALGAQSLRGVGQPVGLWQVRAARSVASVDPRERAQSPFIDRDDHLARLVDRVAGLSDSGRRVLVTVTADAGLGKSRLVQELVSRLALQSTARVLLMRCTEGARLTAFDPVIELMRPLLGCDRSLTAEEQLAALTRSVTVAGLDRPEVVPVLADWLSLALPEALAKELPGTANRRRVRVFEILTALVTQRARAAGALLFIVEDLHWSDASTLAWLRHLAQTVDACPLMLLGTVRGPFESPWALRPGHLALTLRGLDREESLRVIRAAAADKPLALGLSREILPRCDGVPLYLEEVTRALIRSGHLVEQADAWVARGTMADAPIPYGVEAAIRARLDRVGAARHLMAHAAIVGRDCTPTLLALLDHEAPPRLEQHLREMVELGIMVLREDPLLGRVAGFRHAAIRDAAYAAIPHRARAAGHRRVAAALREYFGTWVAEQPEVLARHLAQAGESAQALDLWVRAGERAVQRLAIDEAIAHFEQALQSLAAIAPTDELRRREIAVRVAMAPLVRDGARLGSRGSRRHLPAGPCVVRAGPDADAWLKAQWMRWGVWYSRGENDVARGSLMLGEPAGKPGGAGFAAGGGSLLPGAGRVHGWRSAGHDPGRPDGHRGASSRDLGGR
ncbi:MAG: adenylate/guanylate cyclase domain-containing protein [Burkholderiaceae bacterium]